ncbi:hypothetical protein EOD23_14685 [Mesorhizobium sp. USDA-HM6]|nr:hypothetical protein EOD23_14685 [Mesorhizobium sp. USDA-HM6]
MPNSATQARALVPGNPQGASSIAQTIGYVPPADEVRELLKAHNAHDLWPALSDPNAKHIGTVELPAALKAQDGSGAYAALLELRLRGAAVERMLDFIGQAHGPDADVEIRVLDPKGKGARSLIGRVGQEREQLAAFLRQHDGTWNLYAGVNPRVPSLRGAGTAGNAKHVAGVRFVVFDFDDKDAPKDDPHHARAIARLRALNPFAVITSGNGTHVWFRIEPIIDPTGIEGVKASLAAVMAAIGGHG